MCGRFCRPSPVLAEQEKKERKTSAKLAIYLLPEVPDAEREAEMRACEPDVRFGITFGQERISLRE